MSEKEGIFQPYVVVRINIKSEITSQRGAVFNVTFN